MTTDQIQAGFDYINVATDHIVHVTSVEARGTSVRFHELDDDYMFVESAHYFANDFRPWGR